MTYKNTAKLIFCSLLVASSMTAVSGAAQAQTVWPWYDAFAPQQTRPATVPMKRTRQVQVQPTNVQVSSAAPTSNDCFWCNPRRVYISGLSF